MKIYVAGKFTEQDQVRDVADTLEGKGYTISKKWWELEQTDASVRSMAESRRVGLAEMEGSAICDAMLVFLTDPSYPYKGTLCEMGIALGSRYHDPKKKVLIVTPEGASNRDYAALRVPHVYAADYWFTIKDGEPWSNVVPVIDEYLRSS